MRILVSGCCGFVGSSLLQSLAELAAGGEQRIALFGVDNLSRPGSEQNRQRVGRLARFWHADVRCASDLDALPEMDFVIDASANPSVIAGVDGSASSRQIVEHNLLSTVNLLEFCKRSSAGFWLLSTSRVYSIATLRGLPLSVSQKAFHLDTSSPLPPHVTVEGVDENFSVTAPVSLYGSTKLAAETLALEYASAFGFPVCINRCGLIAGPGQFGRADQGIIAFWINSWLRRRPLQYIGFEGSGHQVRDCLHTRDLAALIWQQLSSPPQVVTPVFNVAGGKLNRFSLAQLSNWCVQRFGPCAVEKCARERQFDIPWLVMDSQLVQRTWTWRPETSPQQIYSEVADHAEANPNWLDISCGK